MIDIRIEVDDKQLRAAFTDWEKRLPLLNSLILRRIAERTVSNCKQYWLTGQSLHVRTGLLRQSISYRMEGSYAVIVGTNVPYAHIHEAGGDIFPRRGKYLAIPMHASAKGHSPRDFPDIFPIRLKDGRLFLARRPMFLTRRRANTGGAIVMMYALKRSVHIPSRPYLRPSIDYTLYSGQAEEIGKRTAEEFIEAEWKKAVN